MLKKMSIRKIMVSTLSLFALLLIYVMPETSSLDYKIEKQNLEYVYTNNLETIYLLDSNDYVARTTIKGKEGDILETTKDLAEGLIIDGLKSNIIPNGFKQIIPSNTEILDLNLEEKTLTINFSKEILTINEKYEEKMIESIVYTLTSINGIDNIIIKVEGEQLKKLPNSGKNLPDVLDKNYGINKKYSLINTNNVDSYTVYYVSKTNDETYYVPITKYVNRDVNEESQDKIKVIIEELSTSPIYETNLMSFLNNNVSLINYNLEDDKLLLNFNDYIFDSDSNNILEEVIYTISLSIEDNYNIKDISFLVNNKEIYKNY